MMMSLTRAVILHFHDTAPLLFRVLRESAHAHFEAVRQKQEQN